jgi:hypothetical protein
MTDTPGDDPQWQLLHDRITDALQPFTKDAFGRGDYWLLDDDWGRFQQELEIQNLNLLKPEIISALQKLLVDFPDWRITMSVAVPGIGDDWPGMGIVIDPEEIIDELQREYLPAEFRSFSYPGARKWSLNP